jgi:hypothetical protein
MMRAAIAISPAPSAGASLDELLAAGVLPRSWIPRRWAACRLPSRMLGCARDLAPDLAWRRYDNAATPLFVMARSSESADGRTDKQAIAVFFLDGLSVVHCAGTWAFDRRSGWLRIDTDDE